jgi:hypothetical protein
MKINLNLRIKVAKRIIKNLKIKEIRNAPFCLNQEISNNLNYWEGVLDNLEWKKRGWV